VLRRKLFPRKDIEQNDPSKKIVATGGMIAVII
jgi:hypothetical protein